MNNQAGLWDMAVNAGPMVKFVLILLLLFSVISWAIIIYKILLIRKAEKETAAFYDMFWESRQFQQIYSVCKNYKATPLAPLFISAYNELMSALKSAGPDRGRLQREDLECIMRVLRKTASVEAARLEYGAPFLATAGNTSPFIGLFGTVWGIMSSFRSIGAKGAANLAVVAPGISEALVATAMGLLVAIPSVVAYNHILARINRITSEMDSFSVDLINIIEKQAGRKAGGE